MIKHSPSTLKWEGNDLLLRVRIQPRAPRNEVIGLHQERLKIRIKAPPVDDKANEALVRFLAEQFETPRAQIVIQSGSRSRNKRLKIQSPNTIPDWLNNLD